MPITLKREDECCGFGGTFAVAESAVSVKMGKDRTLEVASEELAKAINLSFSTKPEIVSSADYIIVTVPTPIDVNKQPDMTPLRKASEMIGKFIKRGATRRLEPDTSRSAFV